MRRRLSNLWSTLAVTALLGLACGGDGLDPASAAVDSIDLSFPGSTLAMSATQPLSPHFLSAGGAILGHVTGVSWTTSNAAVASVDQAGNVHGVALGGPVTITVSADGQTASVTFTVVPDHIAITPFATTLAVSQSLQLTGAPADFNNAVIPSAPGPVTWASNNTAIATVGAASGLVTGVSSGDVVIYGTAAGKTTGLALEVGVPSPYDGSWAGVSICQTCTPVARNFPLSFDVFFGRVRQFNVTVTNAPNAICAFSMSATGHPNATVTDGQFAFTLSVPAGASVTGTFVNATSMNGAHGAISLGAGCTVPNGSGISIVNGSVPAESYTATKQ